ncbi:helix-turn-helix transcriptional regulator [Kitasatospora sp. RB6PN24]|uniref:helix-turn-helix domain-containing protein n=1 Tax=Kitasatospora humi TaxID=2893891 RepID=UPI001E5EFE76|nr:helix-turn-helix transcriptional regulator [Kitasatospora humi]MCC9306398.1 helix-turn-helix transcriptional regulator [Kitasatospora humi]
MSSAHHAGWTVPPEHRVSEEYLAAGRRMALAEAVYARRSALGWSPSELAERAGLTEEEIESIEESGTDPTLPLIERLARALDVVVRLDPAHDPAMSFEAPTA